jgi:AraC family transcriptional regulator
MFHASHPDACAISSPDRSSPCSSTETLVRLLAAALTTFDSDRDTAKACIQQAAELLQVSKNRESHRRNESRALRGGLAPWQVRRVATYIESNIDSPIRVADLACIVRLCTSHFSRTFRESFGETPFAYITRQRIRRAQVIMLSSAGPLSQIALDCGICDHAHFTRVFRRIVGINPSIWRRQFPPFTPAGERSARSSHQISESACPIAGRGNRSGRYGRA